MYNTDYPDRADLPTTGRLIRSTVIAGAASVAVLITLVLPSEYGIDPIGVGTLLGLTPMGEIKVQLAQEAAEQRASQTAAIAAPVAVPSGGPTIAELAARIDMLEALVTELPSNATTQTAPLPELEPLETETASAPEPEVESRWRDEISFTLTPGEGAEYKLVMATGAIAAFEFVVDGGVINYDQHGEGQGQSFSYGEGRAVPGGSGQLQAPVDGTHGWFFRNRGDRDVVVTLRTGGEYAELRKLS